MTLCEWVIDDKGTSDASKWKECSREGTYTFQLKGSNSAANIAFFCWQHIKKYRKKSFLEENFGKGARASILFIGHHNPELNP